MMLITKAQREKMLANGRQTARDHVGNHRPVVKLFMPDGGAAWLLSELSPADPDVAFGLCDLGLGFPELGYVRLSEIAETPVLFGLSVERDRHFEVDKDLLGYAAEARTAGRIVA